MENYCRNKSESRSEEWEEEEEEEGGRGSLVCSVTSGCHGVRRSDTELSPAVWEQPGPCSLTSTTLSQTCGIDTGWLLFVWCECERKDGENQGSGVSLRRDLHFQKV